MKVYLVDFENVKSKGMAGVDNLTEEDTVIIFYSENSDTISFDMHQKVLSSKAEVEYFKVNVGGKNALDFQLSTLLGYLVAKDYYSHIFVISNDKGFDFLHDFWHGKYVASPKCVVFRTKTISAAINYASKNTVDHLEQDEEEFQGIVLAEKSEENAEVVPVQTIEDEQSDTPIEDTVKDFQAENSPTTITEENEQQEEIPEIEIVKSIAENAEQSEETQKPEEKANENKNDKPQKQKRTPKNISKKPVDSFINLLNETMQDSNCSENDIKAIAEMFAKSDTKEELHNSLAKTFKQDATELYKLLRPKYLRLKGLYEQENPQKSEAPASKNQPSKKEKPAQDAPEQPIYHQVISAKLAELLSSLCTQEELDKITKLFFEADTKQQLYIKMVKAFKKDKGCKFYNAIRGEYANLEKQA